MISIVQDPCYKLTDKSIKKFFEDKYLSFMFLMFIDKGGDFLQQQRKQRRKKEETDSIYITVKELRHKAQSYVKEQRLLEED